MVLPFSLSVNILADIKCMAVVAAFLRKVVVQVYPSLDDWLIKDHSRELVEASKAHSVHFL